MSCIVRTNKHIHQGKLKGFNICYVIFKCFHLYVQTKQLQMFMSEMACAFVDGLDREGKVCCDV